MQQSRRKFVESSKFTVRKLQLPSVWRLAWRPSAMAHTTPLIAPVTKSITSRAMALVAVLVVAFCGLAFTGVMTPLTRQKVRANKLHVIVSTVTGPCQGQVRCRDQTNQQVPPTRTRMSHVPRPSPPDPPFPSSPAQCSRRRWSPGVGGTASFKI